jgi:hypothetical protein
MGKSGSIEGVGLKEKPAISPCASALRQLQNVLGRSCAAITIVIGVVLARGYHRGAP